MKPWQFAVVGLALLAAAGCRSDPAVPILERELRLKEDEIYRLRATVEELQDCSQTCQDRGSRPMGREESETPRPRPNSSAPNDERPPAVELPSRPASEVPDVLKSPAGSTPSGVPEVPEHLRGPSPKSSSDRDMSPHADGPSLEKGEDKVSTRPHRMTLAGQSAAAVPFLPGGDSRQVAAIALNRVLTGGISDDDQNGDHGLLVVVEPRDRAGRTVDAPADMSVVVLDPALPGDAARVARWDFTAAETAAMFRRTGSARAIHLTTTWPADPPTHGKLRLFVRYETADGRKLQTETPIEVALSGDKTARWTPNDRSEGSEPPTPQMATRSDDAKPPRPVWSPDRR